MTRLARVGAAAAVCATTLLASLVVFPGKAISQTPACTRGSFKDFHNQGNGAPPPDYKGQVFDVSQDYPNTLPPEESYPWLAVPVSTDGSLTPENAAAYTQALRDYAYAGNIDNDWVVQKNPVRKWYDAPWMDVTKDGREFVHGLTHEIDAQASQHTLGPQQKNNAQTWAVAHFNDRGGWAIGQMWCDPQNPDPDKLNPIAGHPNAMPNGTMIFKLLYSTASDADAPFLAGSFPWTADIYAKTGDPAEDPARTLTQVRVLQMDVAVRDDRFHTGWAFGTFTYNTAAPGNGPFDRMVAVGLQWGNDPGLTPDMIQKEGRPLKEAWINPSPLSKDLPAQHLGWGGRLAGPLDNPQSSCMSCHQTAGYPVEPIIAGIATSPEFPWAPPSIPPLATPSDQVKLNWFLDVPAGVPWSARQTHSLDYSLQLSMGLSRFYAAKCQEEALEENYSPRGAEQASGRETAIDNCPKLAAKVAAKSNKKSGGNDVPIWLVSVIAALVLMVGVVAGRRQQRRLSS